MDAEQQHAYDAGRFGELVARAGAGDWTRASPVAGWTALDVVDHLVTWLPGFLSSQGIELTEVDLADPSAAWAERSAEVGLLLRERGDEELVSPMFGTTTLGTVVTMIYTTDVWMHSWDLARALGHGFDLGEERCEATLAGMLPMDRILRESGQYGPRVPVPDGAPAQDRLLGFIGRDPAFTGPAR